MWICKKCNEENEDSDNEKDTINRFTLKNILSFLNGFLFLIFLIFSFIFPPRVGFGVFGINYDGFDAFFAIIKNTFRSWFGQSLDLESGYYLMPFDRVDSVSDFFEFIAINFAYLIPYLMGGFIIYNLFKRNEDANEKEVIINKKELISEITDDEFFIKERSTGKIKKITDSDWKKIVENGEQKMYEVIYD